MSLKYSQVSNGSTKKKAKKSADFSSRVSKMTVVAFFKAKEENVLITMEQYSIHRARYNRLKKAFLRLRHNI